MLCQSLKGYLKKRVRILTQVLPVDCYDILLHTFVLAPAAFIGCKPLMWNCFAWLMLKICNRYTALIVD